MGMNAVYSEEWQTTRLQSSSLLTQALAMLRARKALPWEHLLNLMVKAAEMKHKLIWEKQRMLRFRSYLNSLNPKEMKAHTAIHNQADRPAMAQQRLRHLEENLSSQVDLTNNNSKKQWLMDFYHQPAGIKL